MCEFVSITADTDSLLDNLRYAFSGRNTFIAELMQNARRAKATKIHIEWDPETKSLVVEDDGEGIENFEKLLGISKSGWNEEIKESEHPYGLGFLAALFAGNSVTIESRGKKVAFSTNPLPKERIPVEKGSRDKGARVVVQGVPDINVEHIKRYACGFPVPVYLTCPGKSRERLPNPRALTDEFSREEEGFFRVTDIGFDEGMINGFPLGTRYTVIYLQGLQVNGSRYPVPAKRANVVHLNSSRFFGRMPDRAQVIDQEEMEDRVFARIETMWRERLSEFVPVASENEEILEKLYPSFRFWGCLDLLDEVPFLPNKVVEEFSCYPYIRHDWEDEYSVRRELPLISRSQVENNEVILVQDDFDQDIGESFGEAVYLYSLAAEKPIYRLFSKTISPNHWAQNYIKRMQSGSVQLEAKDLIAEGTFSGYHVRGFKVLIYKDVRLKGPFGVSKVHCPFYFDGFDTEDNPVDAIIVPESARQEMVVRQIDVFLDELDSFLEEDVDREDRMFFNFVEVLKCADNAHKVISEVVERHTEHVRDYLAGKTVQISFDEKGLVKQVLDVESGD